MADSQPRNLLPIRTWLPQYERGWLRYDLIAALTTWALVVPQAIAYGQLAGLPAQAGLYAAFAALLAYALFATSRHLVVSPTSSTAIVSAALVAPLAMGDPARFAALSAMLALLVGGVFVVYGLLNLGFVSQFISASVQVGLMFGLGLTIIASQLPKLLGIPGGEGTFVDQAANILAHLGQTNWTAVLLGVSSLAVLLLLKRYASRVPAALVVVAGSILLVTLLGLADRGLDVIGTVDAGLPRPAIPWVGWSDILALLGGAIVVSLIAYAESDAVAEQFADKHHYDINPNQELVALGAANAASGLFQGFIVAGGASQSAANESAGAKSQLSNLIVSGLILLTVVVLMPLFSNLAQAVLGAIVISAVLGFINVAGLRRIYELRRDSFALAVVTLLAVLILGVLPGLIVAIIISVVLLLARAAQPDVVALGRLPSGGDYASLARHPEAQPAPGLLLFRPDVPLFSFNARHIRQQLLDQVGDASPPARVVVLDLGMNADLDIEGLETLRDLHQELAAAGVALWLAQPHGHAQDLLAASGLADRIGREHIYATVGEAAAAYTALPADDAA
jgi:high affinity sulfate transporter 1